MDARQQASAVGGTHPMDVAQVTVRFWAGARAAAGVESERVPAPATVGDLREALVAAHPDLSAVLPVCSLLVDGLATDPADPVPAGAVVEVLPPFAGG